MCARWLKPHRHRRNAEVETREQDSSGLAKLKSDLSNNTYPYFAPPDLSDAMYGSSGPEPLAPTEREQWDDTNKGPEKRDFSRRELLKLGGGVLTAAGFTAVGLKASIAADQMLGDYVVWPSTGTKVHEVAMNGFEKPPAGSGTFVFEGFGSKDATLMAKALYSSLQSAGRVYALEYDNHGIEVDDIVASIITEIDEGRLTEISFYGRSMGGDVALLVACGLLKKHPNLSVKNIILDCTPSGVEAVRGWDKETIESIEQITAELDAYGGPTLRMAVELLHSPKASEFIQFKPTSPYVDVSNMTDRAADLFKRKINSKATSNRMLVSQIKIILSMDVSSCFAELSKLTEHQIVPLLITEIRPENPDQDDMVLNDVSERNFRSACNGLRIRFNVVSLIGKDIRHADPRAFHSRYNAVLLKEIQSFPVYSVTTKPK